MTAGTGFSLDEIDLSDPQVFGGAQAGDIFRTLRREAPVHWNASKGGQDPFWSLTRYEDIIFVSRNPHVFSSEFSTLRSSTPPPNDNEPDMRPGGGIGKMLLRMDPPRHARLRRLISKGFTPASVRLMENEIRQIARTVVDEVQDRGTCDFVVDIASKVPVAVICGMMGIPPSDWGYMFELTNRTVGTAESASQSTAGGGGQEAALGEMFEYFQGVIRSLRGGKRGPDIVSILVDAEVDGEKLTDEELLWFCALLIIAGNETTRNGLSGGMRVLSEHPAEKAKLLANPELMGSAVEEILRWVTPVSRMARLAKVDTEIRGVRIRQGDRVVMWYPSANRDEEVFPDADRFDITRTPNEHLAFGIGEHFCLGAGFARMEMRVMYEELFARFPDIDVSGPAVTPRLLGGINAITHLPVRFTPVSAGTR